MIETIKNIIILILSVISGSIPIVTIIIKKYQKTKLDGIEKISKLIENLKHEKVCEQKRVVKERSDILFSEFHAIFCKNIPANSESKEAIYYKTLILDSVRNETDKMMNEVIYINNITGREGSSWLLYKESKFKFILTRIIAYISQIYKDELIGVSHADAIVKCREDIVKTYMLNIDPMFEEIKTVCMEFEKKIMIQEKFLTDLKNGKRKK